MAQIGQFTRDKSGFTGRIHTLTVDRDLTLVPAESWDAENAPDFRIHLGDAEGPEIGAGWKRAGEKAGDYVSLVIDDPLLARPIRANLFRSGNGKSVSVLNWNRPPKRSDGTEPMRFQLPIASGMARTSFIPLFAKRPSHPSVPLENVSAVARRRRQGWPLAGVRALPLTAASTMARWCRKARSACARTALLTIAAVISVIASAPPAHPQMAATRVQTASDPLSAFVTEAAQRFGLPVAWIRAVMRAESHGDRSAISPKGAMGVMQLMPDTWAGLRIRYGLGRDPFDPHDNVLAGAAYLREMHDRYGSPGFLAAYNAGPRRYEDYRDRRRPLPDETIAYVAELLPLIDDGNVDPAALTASATRLAWGRASLFAMLSNDEQAAHQRVSNRSSRDASAAVAVRDISAIAPQSKGLFVALSSSGRAP